ncbi:hypothetical protein [Methanococcus maripaludis]|uniref:Uncharacterized protein n=1 Tax=Methanococcus maripaludis TaxID=39152 RepID=A0A7J9S078_METMI|nr:hypothetical protein [Methanococcus maripaludis]MBB6067871.1 hypothetical protein [Methanococcus maripaludis]
MVEVSEVMDEMGIWMGNISDTDKAERCAQTAINVCPLSDNASVIAMLACHLYALARGQDTDEDGKTSHWYAYQDALREAKKPNLSTADVKNDFEVGEVYNDDIGD